VKRPLIVVTALGIPTSMSWWSCVSVEGKAVVVSAVGKDADDGCSLVLANLRSQGEAQAFLRTLVRLTEYGARTYRASDWPGTPSPAPRPLGIDSRDGILLTAVAPHPDEARHEDRQQDDNDRERKRQERSRGRRGGRDS
jgi:hypothetical protein